MYSSQSDFQVIEAGVRTIEGNDKVAVLEIGIGSAMVVGPEQALPVPIALHRYPFNKRNLAELIAAAQAAHDTLAGDSDLVTASSLAGVEKIAGLNERFRG